MDSSRHMQKNKTIAEPQIADWTPSLDWYLSIVEYLIKRQVAIIDAKGETLSAPIMLPTADKHLVKGHNSFVSSNVGEVMLNHVACGAVHVRCDILASMRDTRYDVKRVIDGESSLIHHASCQCPAGAGEMQPCGSCFVCHAGLCDSHAQPRLLHKQGPGVASAKTCNKTGHETTRRGKAQS